MASGGERRLDITFAIRCSLFTFRRPLWSQAMPIYRAPVEDYKFLLHELFEVEKQTDLPRYADLSSDLIDDILTNAGKFCEDVLQPINQSGDEEGCHFAHGI